MMIALEAADSGSPDEGAIEWVDDFAGSRA
jgi:hypothetical protein